MRVRIDVSLENALMFDSTAFTQENALLQNHYKNPNNSFLKIKALNLKIQAHNLNSHFCIQM